MSCGHPYGQRRVGTRVLVLTLMVAELLTPLGCASLPGDTREPVAVSQIIAMSKEGISTTEIIAQIRASQTVYRLKASQLADLREQGVADEVIDHMQQTYLEAVREEQRRLDVHYHWLFDDDGFWYKGLRP